jgi:transaldolase
VLQEQVILHRIAEICQAVPRVESVSAEVTPDALTSEDMIAQAEELIKINGGDEKVTIKLPMTLAGLEACGNLQIMVLKPMLHLFLL